MAITDFATLKTAVANWTARADLTSIIPDFITLAESRINRDLKVRQMLSTVGLTASSGSFTLPSDFISAVRVSRATGGVDIELLPITSAKNLNARLGQAVGYVVEGSAARIIGGAGSEDITLSYYGKIPTIVSNNNWLITNYPDIYLYAALVEASPYIGKNDNIQVWANGYTTAVESLQRSDSEARFGASPRMTVDFYAP